MKQKRGRRRKLQMEPLRCQFLEFTPKQWLYAVETPETRISSGFNYGLWDWREFALLAGPFVSLDAAKKAFTSDGKKADISTVQEFSQERMNKIGRLLKLKIDKLLSTNPSHSE